MPEPSQDQPLLSPVLAHLLRASGVLFVVSLSLVLLDVAWDIRMPGILRPALPWLLLASMLVGTTLLVGALGMPGRPDKPDRPLDE